MNEIPATPDAAVRPTRTIPPFEASTTALAFPKLEAGHIARIAHLGKERGYALGELLYDQGWPNTSFFVVLRGRIEVVLPQCNDEQLIAELADGQFTGDVALLSDRNTIARARALEPTQVLEIHRDQLQALLQTDAELGELLLRAFIQRRVALIANGRGDICLLGSRYSADTLKLQEFLTRNGHPYRYVDIERDPQIQHLLDHFNVTTDDVPVVICRGERVLRKPTIEELAECIGISRLNYDKVRDLVVVGAGPAGLAAAVYASSEGLDTLVVEANAPGGQAGSSSRIENYLGFPTGISGQDLAARAFIQAEKFGADVVVARTALRLNCDELPYRIYLADGRPVQTRAVVIATGVQYRKPDIPDLARFEGCGIYYGATQVEANVCNGEEVIVVGGGNSAGQAAVFLSGCSSKVHMMVRSDGLAATMSKYLIRRIEETPNIELKTCTQIEALAGNGHLEQVTVFDKAGGNRAQLPVKHVFLMTGANPNTGWLDGCVLVDEKGFVKAGQDITPEELSLAKWPLKRTPLLFETSLPGVFAVGDVRANSTKRVAAAVGEDSVCIQLVHRVLAGA